MQVLIGLIQQYGLTFVFLNVLAEQAGIPLPAYPTLIVAGALISRGDYTAPQMVAVAVIAALIADLAWYFAGTRIGRPVLRVMCRISLSPDNCVRQTESIYARFGAPSLLVAKFIPGFAAVATALAGALRTRLSSFILFDGLGAALWAGVAVTIGIVFRDAITQLLDTLNALGRIGLILILIAFGLVVLGKWWQRYRFYKELRMARISVDELRTMVDEGAQPIILDVRSSASQAADGRIPGAIAIDDKTFEGVLPLVSPDGDVIVYCACPNEASAARIAKMLMARGYKRVRPLHGGIDAWVEAGYGLEY